MEEKYKLTKEEKKLIKNFIHVGNIAKRRVQTWNNGDDLIERMKNEKDKSGKDLNIRDTMEAHLKQCNQLLYEGPPGDEWTYLDLVIESPATKETKYGRTLEKLKPYIKKYIGMLKEAINTHELYKKQKVEFEETGTITSEHWTVDLNKTKEYKKMLEKNREKNEAWRDWFIKETAKLMKKYKLTKEEKENIKKLNSIRKKAKEWEKLKELMSKYPDKPNVYDTLFRHIFEKRWKSIGQDQIRGIKSYIQIYGELRQSLKEDLNFCKKIQSNDAINMILDSETEKMRYDTLEKKLKPYIEKKLKPDIEKYIISLEETLKVYNEYAKRLFNSIKYDAKVFVLECDTELIKDRIVDESLITDGLIKFSERNFKKLYDHIQPEFIIQYGQPPRRCNKLPLLKEDTVECSYAESDELFKYVTPKFRVKGMLRYE